MESHPNRALQREPTTPERRAPQDSLSQRVFQMTGRSLDEWKRIIDALGGQRLPDIYLTNRLRDEFRCSDKEAQFLVKVYQAEKKKEQQQQKRIRYGGGGGGGGRRY
jgi:hypothetical protein